MSAAVDAAALAPRARTPWWASACLAAAFAAFALLAVLELSARADRPASYDDLYFMVCAQWGLAAGEVPVSGCHDSKAPLVFLVHQAVQALAGGVSFAGAKLAGFALALANAGAAFVLSRQLGGLGRLGAAGSTMAGLLAAMGVLHVFGIDTRLMGLKTEIVGTTFLLLSLIAFARWLQQPRAHWAAWAGLAFGLALAAKQSFVFAVPGFVLSAFWLLTTRRLGLAALLRGVAAFAPMAVLPLAAFAAAFALQGQLDAFLGALLLYPTAYRPDPSLSAAAQWALKASGLASFLADGPHVALLALVGGLAVLVRAVRGLRPARAAVAGEPTDGAADLAPLLMLVGAAGGMVALLLIAPVQFYYHLLPGWMLMAVLAGHTAARWLSADPAAPPGLGSGWVAMGRVAVIAVLVLGAAHALWQSWGQWRSPAREWNLRWVPDLSEYRGQPAYVVGVWPTFYVRSGLLPASSVLYPNALPGAPAAWNYRPPQPGDPVGDRLIALQQDNARRLLADFARTPPRFIHVIDSEARAPGSAAATDIPVLADYLRAHCRFDRLIDGTPREKGTLYACH